jgi:hypothetical protein
MSRTDLTASLSSTTELVTSCSNNVLSQGPRSLLKKGVQDSTGGMPRRQAGFYPPKKYWGDIPPSRPLLRGPCHVPHKDTIYIHVLLHVTKALTKLNMFVYSARKFIHMLYFVVQLEKELFKFYCKI